MSPQEMVRLYTEEKLSASTIAYQARKSKETVLYHLHRQGVVTRGRSEARELASNTWTDERVAKLRELWPTEMTSKAIGRALGVSGGAVAGKADRLGLPMKKAPLQQRARVLSEAAMSPPFEHHSLITFPDPLMSRFRECVEAARVERRWA